MDEKAPPVMEMSLCEQDFIFLRPNQLYIFRVNPNCARCVEIAKMHEPVQIQH